MNIADVLSKVPEKGIDTNTTSKKFKLDIFDFFDPLYPDTCVEVAGCHGNTTYILSHVFKQVVYVEHSKFPGHPDHFERVSAEARKLLVERHNIVYAAMDAYEEPWPFRYVDTFFIDCSHYYVSVRKDIQNAKRCLKPNGFIILDDWSLPFDNFGVRRAVQDEGLNIIKYVGENIRFNPSNVFEFKFGIGEPEGIIVRL